MKLKLLFFIGLSLLVRLNGYSQTEIITSIKTPILASDFTKSRKPIYFLNDTLYTISESNLNVSGNNIYLYSIDVKKGIFTKTKINISYPFISKLDYVKDLVIYNRCLILGTGKRILIYKLDGDEYVFFKLVDLEYEIGRLFIHTNFLITEDYYNYHDKDQKEKHVRQIIDLLSYKVESVYFLDSKSANFTPVLNNFFDIYEGNSLCVQSQEMNILVGKYRFQDYSDTIKIPKLLEKTCDSIIFNESDILGNIHKINELDNDCLERIDKAYFLSENRILVSINFPVFDENAVFNKTKRIIIYEKRQSGWELISDDFAYMDLPDSLQRIPLFFRSGIIFSNLFEFCFVNNVGYQLNYGKMILPIELPYDRQKYSEYLGDVKKKDKSLSSNIWLVLYNLKELF